MRHMGWKLARTGVVGTALASVLSACTASAPPPVAPSNQRMTGISVAALDHSVSLRDLAVADPGTAGYRAGSSAPLIMQVWNDTNRAVGLTGVTAAGGGTVVFVDGPVPSSPVASRPPDRTSYAIPVPPGGPVALRPDLGKFLLIRCLPTDVAAGVPVNLTFHFDNGATITADVPMAGAYPPQPRVAPIPGASGRPAGTACA
jgi:copper(I)-binding protein